MLKAAERVLAQEIGEAASPEEAARATARVYERLSQCLTPVLGEAGFHALYCRSLKLIKPRLACLDALPTDWQVQALLDQLRSCLALQEPAACKEVGVALLAAFGDLLATFIGERLTWRLLHEAWPEAVADHPKITGENMSNRVQIHRVSTGVPGLDEVLGGGLPEFSFNLIAGAPGSGKTTLGHQIMFANTGGGRKAIYFTIVGEPPLKMLRYQQQFPFFDAAKVNDTVRFVHLGKELSEGGLPRVLERIEQEIEAVGPALVFVDSFRSLARAEDELTLQRFVQKLAINLATCHATTFLIGEYQETESGINPIFTVADGILWLYQQVVGNSVVRRMQVLKIRGQKQSPGLHAFVLTSDGMRVFPRLPKPEQRPGPRDRSRKKTGVGELDKMLGGGIPAGYSVLVAGPSGSGKSVLATQFIVEGVERGEPGVIAVFGSAHEATLRAKTRYLDGPVREGKVAIVELHPLDLSVSESFEEIREAWRRIGAKRVVIDSLSGFELALAPAFREDFRESLYTLLGALTQLGVTVLLTVEVVDSFAELRFSPQEVSFLTDGIILQRYVEIDGALRRVMAVIKLRACQHSKELQEYEVTEKGIVLGEALKGYTGILTGSAVRTGAARKKKQKARKART